MSSTTDNDAVAIIGMAGRFPGARDVREFWTNLLGGVDSITRDVGADGSAGAASARAAGGARAWTVSAGGVLDDVESFDAEFFAIPPIDAAWMDPQHRLFLECAWLALEDAGRPPMEIECPVSVYAGTNFNSYLPGRLDQLAGKDAVQFLQILMGNEKDFLATRVSYKLNLRGESLTVQTSCSTSLVAVHLACQSLLSGQSDMALAGGVSIRIPQRASYRYEAGMIASPDGHCRPFDHRAAGTVPGNGVGVVVLKRLADAVADHDHCYAVILGSWVNNDGRAKVGFTAPAVDAQAAVVSRGLAMAGVHAESIRFVETHGTGTPMGDPIEVEALTRAFRQHTARRRFCALGAVKASIGHLDTAAGVAGLIKTSLALHHRCIPPAAYFERPNPAIDFESSPFYVNPSAEAWSEGPAPRRAGVSGFGVGGTNVHLVLQEPPVRARRAAARPVQIVTVSARSAAARDGAVARLARALEQPEAPRELRDVAYTQNVGRVHFNHRQFAVADTPESLIQTLRSSADLTAEVRQPAPSIVFMFAGQGTQSAGMARALHDSEPVFRDVLDACVRRANARLGVRLEDVLLAPAGTIHAAAHANERLARPSFALPALFCVEYALTQLWAAWGIKPDAVIGHSYGELVAACVAGVCPVDEGITLAVERGRLMERMPPGVMLAVPLSEADVMPLLDKDVSLASINGDARTVLSGAVEAIARVERTLAAQGVPCRRLDVPCAYHSPAIDPLIDDYTALLRGITLTPPRLRCASNLTGAWLSDAEACDPEYWARQMREPVRFAAALRHVRAEGHACFIEIGPGQTLTSLARLALDRGALVLASLSARHGAHADWYSLLTAVGRLWLAGARLDWRVLERPQEGWPVPLPGYAFDRQRHWIEPSASRASSSSVAAAAPAPAEAGAEGGGEPLAGARPAGQEPAGIEAIVRGDEDEPARIQRILTAIWCEVFGRTSVGADDDFLELGGDSLAAIRVQSRLVQAVAIDVPLEEVLTLTTIRSLAAVVARRTAPALAARAHASAAVEAAWSADASSTAREELRPQAVSFAQEWLWTLHGLTSSSAAYHLPIAVRLRGGFSPSLFSSAVDRVSARHESLRTTFAVHERRPAAIVQPPRPQRLPLVDVSACVEPARLGLARRVAKALMLRPFDMAAAPPWRACLVRLAGDDHIAVFVLHHIISDAWSTGLLVREVALCYLARREGRVPELAPLPVQYPEFARRQRAAVDRDGTELVAWWKRQLAQVPPLLTLSPRPRPATLSHIGARHRFAIDAAIVRRLTSLTRRERATLFMVLLAAFETLLYRTSDQDDFCVGVPTAGRLEPDLEPLIGCFINTLPIRASVRGNPAFAELLRRVRRTVLDAFARQALPFGKIVEELRPPRHASHTPIFQVVFDFNTTPRSSAPGPADGALELASFGVPMATAKTDLIVDLWAGGEGELQGSVEYDVAVFDEAHVTALMASYVALLDAAAEDPACRLTALPLESAAARAARASDARGREAAARDRLLAIRAGRQAAAGASSRRSD